MHEISINSNGVKKLLKDLKPYKAPGPDGIPTFILRAASEELAPIRSRVYQFSLDNGEVPSEWREENSILHDHVTAFLHGQSKIFLYSEKG